MTTGHQSLGSWESHKLKGLEEKNNPTVGYEKK